MIKNRLIRIGGLSLIALAVIGALAYLNPPTARPPANQSTVAGTPIGGPFTLTDHTGSPFNQDNISGHYVLIYFGFTFCPAICPTELQKMTLALNQAGEQGGKVLPVFITIDPERDTVETVSQYIKNFHSRFIGLTGTGEQISSTLKAYHVYARRVDDPASTEYTMDHSSYIYLIGPGGDLIALFGTDSKPSEIAAKIREVVEK